MNGKCIKWKKVFLYCLTGGYIHNIQGTKNSTVKKKKKNHIPRRQTETFLSRRCANGKQVCEQNLQYN